MVDKIDATEVLKWNEEPKEWRVITTNRQGETKQRRYRDYGKAQEAYDSFTRPA